MRAFNLVIAVALAACDSEDQTIIREKPYVPPPEPVAPPGVRLIEPNEMALGATRIVVGNGVAADAAGNVYLAGSTSVNLDGNPTELYGSDIFVAKFDGNGVGQWVRQYLNPDLDSASDAAINGAGDVYVVGQCTSSSPAIVHQACLMKIDAAGGLLWSQLLGTGDIRHTTHGTGVAVDASGFVYIVGDSTGGVGGNTHFGDFDAFLAKYDPAGALLWSRTVGSSDVDGARDVATGADGSVYLCGMTLGSIAPPALGNGDAFLTKFDASGTLVWTRQFGSPGGDAADAIAVDPNGGAYVVGGSNDEVDGNTSAGMDRFQYDVILWKFDGEGARQWTRQNGEAGGNIVHAAVRDGRGHVRAIGRFDPLQEGWPDALLVEWDADGGLVSQRRFGSLLRDEAHAIAVGPADSVFVTGYSHARLDPESQTSSSHAAFLVKLGPDGAFLWQ